MAVTFPNCKFFHSKDIRQLGTFIIIYFQISTYFVSGHFRRRFFYYILYLRRFGLPPFRRLRYLGKPPLARPLPAASRGVPNLPRGTMLEMVRILLLDRFYGVPRGRVTHFHEPCVANGRSASGNLTSSATPSSP